jgi:two-component system, OmpR family, sensor histidine kinase ChvG
MKRRGYTLRTLILSIILVVLALPLIGIGVLRVFESFLHRQTEAKLVAEGTYIQLLYVSALRHESGGQLPIELTRHLTDIPPPADGYYHPYFASLDLLEQSVLDPPPEATQPTEKPLRVAQMAGHKIQPILSEAQRQNLSGIRVLDVNGVVVASTGDQLGLSLVDRVEVQEALAGRYSSVVRRREKQPSNPGIFNRAGRVRIHVAIPILRGEDLVGVVYLNRTGLSLFRDAWEGRYTATLLGILVLTILIGLALSLALTRPLKKLIAGATLISKGAGPVSLDVGRTAPREAFDLADALNAMVHRLEERFEYVREFTRSVSHEFKTPLASIQGSIELLSEGWDEMAVAERQRFLEIIDSDVHRMDRLVQRLTKLTRIELAGRSDSTTDLEKMLPELIEQFAARGATISMEINTDKTMVPLAKDLAETLFGNLIDNAVKHGGGTPVRVTISRGPKVEISDQGPGISSANLERVFERFFTTARESGGTGLGLSMVKAIADAHGAEIKVDSDAKGAVFQVIFS